MNAERTPLRAPAMLGITVGMFMVIGGGLVLLFAVAAALLSAFGPSGSGSGRMLLAVAGAVVLGLIRLKLSITMFRADKAPQPLCIASAVCSSACVAVLLIPGSPGPLTIGLLAIAAADGMMTLWIMFTESRRLASEGELERLKAERRVEP